MTKLALLAFNDHPYVWAYDPNMKSKRQLLFEKRKKWLVYLDPNRMVWSAVVYERTDKIKCAQISVEMGLIPNSLQSLSSFICPTLIAETLPFAGVYTFIVFLW